jgi:hypothetical protein
MRTGRAWRPAACLTDSCDQHGTPVCSGGIWYIPGCQNPMEVAIELNDERPHLLVVGKRTQVQQCAVRCGFRQNTIKSSLFGRIVLDGNLPGQRSTIAGPRRSSGHEYPNQPSGCPRTDGSGVSACAVDLGGIHDHPSRGGRRTRSETRISFLIIRRHVLRKGRA